VWNDIININIIINNVLMCNVYVILLINDNIINVWKYNINENINVCV